MKWILTSFSFSIVICYHPLIALLFTLGKIDIMIFVFWKWFFKKNWLWLFLSVFELKSVSVNNWINWPLHKILWIFRIFQIYWWIWYYCQIFYKKFQYLNSKKSNKSSGNSAVAIVNRDELQSGWLKVVLKHQTGAFETLGGA